MGRTFRNERKYFDDEGYYDNRRSNYKSKKIKTYQNDHKSDKRDYIDKSDENDDWDEWDDRR